ncbi:recombinase family protein [Streptomyces sp. NBC_00006]|uniref:recombinase family protein n=1 Tax=Streptomyces sp. NBC_00006 TaxID=2975619 RepID=UPI00225C405F|nr:recombinase family protein [Streptomyces sp. NBC_00006]MCX5532997.1 recombinase family protein [Streptomyces sp. NBC_00006]
MRAAALGIYVRQSDVARGPDGSPDGGAVARQEAACRRLVVTLGGVVVRVYDDNARSASLPGVPRPAFDELIADLAAGVIDGFVFVHADRVARRASDAARVCAVYEEHPQLLGRSVEGGVDLATHEGRTRFLQQVLDGGSEADATARRQRSANLHRALAGQPHIGATAWGWDKEGRLQDPAASLLRRGIEAAAEGACVREIRADWLDHGVTGRTGKPVSRKTVLLRLINPRNAGYRIYASAEERRASSQLWTPDLVLHDDVGLPVKGEWQRVAAPATYWPAVRSLKEQLEGAHERGHSGPPPGLCTRLLSGRVRCAECGASMVVSSRTVRTGTAAGTRQPFYRCPAINGGCGRLSRTAASLESYVADQLLARLRQVATAAVPSTPVTTDAGATYRYSALARRQGESIRSAQHAIAHWGAFELPEQRAQLAAHVDEVRLRPAPRGRWFDPATVDIRWADRAAPAFQGV